MTSADRYVDTERGIISREIFVNDGIFAEELEKLFARAWLFVGHESQIPEPGDYFTSRMGTESVILCRDKTRRIHVFLNTCRHRGMKVCRYDQGNTPLFTCPYHNWSYATDGRLAGVPMHKELYPDLDRSEWSLIEVPRMVNYKGAIFASWDPDAPEFVDYLGDAKDHLDQVLDCRDGREGGSEVFGGVHKWIIPANWKFAAENFCGDTYHNPSHRSVDLIGIGPSSAKGGAAGRRDNEYQGGQHVWVSFPSGHGVHSVWMPPNPPYVETFQDNKIVADYFRHCYHERTAPARRQGAVVAVHRHDLSEQFVSRPPAARAVRLASRSARRRPKCGASSSSIAMRRPRSRSCCAAITCAMRARPE